MSLVTCSFREHYEVDATLAGSFFFHHRNTFYVLIIQGQRLCYDVEHI